MTLTGIEWYLHYKNIIQALQDDVRQLTTTLSLLRMDIEQQAATVSNLKVTRQGCFH